MKKLYSIPVSDSAGCEFTLNAAMTEAQYAAMCESGTFIAHMDRAGELLAIGDMDVAMAQAELEGHRINGRAVQ